MIRYPRDYPESTVQDVMEVHRATVNQLEETIEHLEWKIREEQQQGDKYSKLLHDHNLLRDRNKRLEQVIDSLKLDLANEREAHNKTKEKADE